MFPLQQEIAHVCSPQRETKVCMLAAAGNQAVHVCSGKAMQINDGRTEDMDQEVA